MAAGAVEPEMTHVLILTQVNITFCEFLPCYKLAWRAVDSLPGELDRPFVLALRTEEFALYMKEGIGLRCLLDRGGHDLNGLDFLV